MPSEHKRSPTSDSILPDARPLRVLFVEDDEDDMHLLSRDLARGGYTVHVQRVDSHAALVRALREAQPWDIILSDYNIPGFSGLDALKTVRSAGLDVPFVVVSGAVGEEQAAEIMRAGANDFILKSRTARLLPVVARELRDADERRRRREVEVALASAEERFTKAFQENPLASAVVVLKDWRCVDVNRRFAALFDPATGNRRAMIGRPLADVLHLDDGTAHALREAMQHGTSLSDFEVVLVLQNIPHDFLLSMEIITLGNTPCGMVMLQNISPVKRAQQALLERARLRMALDKEREIGELRTRMMRVIAHELRNPLSLIQLSADLLANSFDTMAPPSRMKRLTNIRTQVTHLRMMMDVIETAARSQFAPFTPVPLLLPDEVERLVSEVAQSFSDGHQVLFVPSGQAQPTLADRNMLRWMMVNLVSNAVKYSAPGSTVHVALSSDIHGSSLRVADEGIGIPEDEIPRLFEPFYRAKNVGSAHGTGLGLNVVKDSVDAHGGSVHVASQEGVGTTVHVFLPLRSPSAGDVVPIVPSMG